MLKLTSTLELSAVEIVLLENIYHILNRLETLTQEITANIDSYGKVIEAAREMKYINAYNGSLVLLKDQFFEHALPGTLSKIANELKFKPAYAYQDDFIIPKIVLKEFRYSSEIKSTDPKADIAKKLGAKVVL